MHTVPSSLSFKSTCSAEIHTSISISGTFAWRRFHPSPVPIRWSFLHVLHFMLVHRHYTTVVSRPVTRLPRLNKASRLSPSHHASAGIFILSSPIGHRSPPGSERQRNGSH